MCRWLTKTYGSQNVFDDLGFSDFQRWQRKLMAEREITEEYKLQNCLCFCRKSPSFNNSPQKMYYIPGYTAVNSKVFWFLSCIFFCRSCLLIYSPPSLWLNVCALFSHLSNYSPQLCKKLLLWLVNSNSARCYSISSKLPLIHSTQRKELKVTGLHVYNSYCWLSLKSLHRQNFILKVPVVIRTKW